MRSTTMENVNLAIMKEIRENLIKPACPYCKSHAILYDPVYKNYVCFDCCRIFDRGAAVKITKKG